MSQGESTLIERVKKGRRAYNLSGIISNMISTEVSKICESVERRWLILVLGICIVEARLGRSKGSRGKEGG